MVRLNARVTNGRLVLDVPTDLPDGSVVPLEIAPEWDELDEATRAMLHAEIATSLSERTRGAPTFDARDVLAELGPKR